MLYFLYTDAGPRTSTLSTICVPRIVLILTFYLLYIDNVVAECGDPVTTRHTKLCDRMGVFRQNTPTRHRLDLQSRNITVARVSPPTAYEG